MRSRWYFEEFTTVAGSPNRYRPDMFVPPFLRIPVLYGPRALSATECRKLRDLILRMEEQLLKASRARPVAGLEDGVTTRWLAYNLFAWKHDEVRPLKNAVAEAYRVFLNSSRHRRWKNSAQCWANILRVRQSLTPHVHNYLPEASINGTVSLTNVDTETILIFPFPLWARYAKRQYERFSLRTTLGQMIVMPGWLAHMTTPVPDGQTRVTLGFDIAKEFTKGSFIDFDDPRRKAWPAFD